MRGTIRGMADRVNPTFAVGAVGIPLLSTTHARPGAPLTHHTSGHVISGVLWIRIDLFVGRGGRAGRRRVPSNRFVGHGPRPGRRPAGERPFGPAGRTATVVAPPELALLAVLALAVVGSVAPGVPGGLLSVGGLVGYYWLAPSPAFGPIAFAGFLLLALLAFGVSLFGGAVAAAGQEAATATVVGAGVAGVALLLVAGPIGLLVGMFAVALAGELWAGSEVAGAAEAAVWTTVGMLLGSVGEFLLTVAVFVGVAVAVVV